MYEVELLNFTVTMSNVSDPVNFKFIYNEKQELTLYTDLPVYDFGNSYSAGATLPDEVVSKIKEIFSNYASRSKNMCIQSTKNYNGIFISQTMSINYRNIYFMAYWTNETNLSSVRIGFNTDNKGLHAQCIKLS